MTRASNTAPRACTRRRFLKLCAGTALTVAAFPTHARVRPSSERWLAFHNLHTGEHVRASYWVDGESVAEGLTEINQVLRDHRTGEVHPIDNELLDLLHALQHKLDNRQPFQVISGFRSPKTNQALRQRGNGVAKRSLHMLGQAIDVRLPGCELPHLRDAAKQLRGGGVGYYSRANFVHLDVGRVRYW